jgi:hypothetical protein
MNRDDLFTPESIALFSQRTGEAAQTGRSLFDQYRQDREAEIRESPDLWAWIDALEDGDLPAATDPGLWARLAAGGFIEIPVPRTPYPDRAVIDVRIISPKVLDAVRTARGPASEYAFTTVRVCLRRQPVPAGLNVPSDLADPAIIDTELFELPPAVTGDVFDDREKIHVVYIAGMRDGQFVATPIYIGVATGEAYGTGPRQRSTRGRFRQYRYDVKDNDHIEHIKLTQGPDEERENVRSHPPVPAIGDSEAPVLLARGADDRSFMSISDPQVARWHEQWLAENPQNRLVYRRITLQKVRDDLRRGSATTEFPPDDVASVLEHTWRVQRWYYVAWQHPSRLTAAEGIDLYYDLLPAFRREEYEIYRFKPEIFGVSPDDPLSATLTIPAVLRSEELREQLERSRPGAVAALDRWFQREVERDLYAYGGHPELRLCTAIALWFRLSRTGVWDASVEAAYRGRLFEVDLSAQRVSTDRPASGVGR